MKVERRESVLGVDHPNIIMQRYFEIEEISRQRRKHLECLILFEHIKCLNVCEFMMSLVWINTFLACKIKQH